MTAELTTDEARRIAVAAQGLHPVQPATPTAAETLARLGCLQIDSMSAVRRSHELVLLGRGVTLDQALTLGTAAQAGTSFEGMAHALSLVPLDLWPAFGFRRRRILADGWRGPAVDTAAVDRARDVLQARGRVRLRDFGRTTGTGWERDSVFRWALEWLAATGGAVCAERDRWERVYCLPELALPEHLLRTELPDDACLRLLCARAVDALGVATTKDVADYFRLRPAQAEAALTALRLERRTVAGWREPVWLAPEADPGQKVDEDAVTPLSPFDSLIWTRERQLRLFGKDYRLEAYKPAAKREFGYFALPVLYGADIVGRLALRRRPPALVVENSELDDGLAPAVLERAAALAAEWTGSDTVSHERDHA
ncbi:DNA glycosylase AlkZ-like family protein [Kitasatospora sp. DSM 101779]|uniref:DNA glycosylase AlkZ-like family protein n=1 Tax=Kitasatospora sp. DSM 101779 TaxID=2853165 RepID=UPI0021D7F8A0|nr:crosslink repair DNA glycosylase YcaQ family protein [Kitasatospora sp. DSM 101779]MCU7820433.1 winged helix DNA-binding domain-containing protein [Kitasatospora sp. DSM 101779]